MSRKIIHSLLPKFVKTKTRTTQQDLDIEDLTTTEESTTGETTTFKTATTTLYKLTNTTTLKETGSTGELSLSELYESSFSIEDLLNRDSLLLELLASTTPQSISRPALNQSLKHQTKTTQVIAQPKKASKENLEPGSHGTYIR